MIGYYRIVFCALLITLFAFSKAKGSDKMRNYKITDIKNSEEMIQSAAKILFTVFQEINPPSWPTYESALEEVNECLENGRICLGLFVDEKLIGWAGLREQYEKTWELHPIVIAQEYQGQGWGKILLKALEKRGVQKGVEGIVLGTDDETFRTSLSQTELSGDNLFSEIQNIKNLNHHPYEFYRTCGYNIVGVIPNANGKNKPDIWMWKSLL